MTEPVVQPVTPEIPAAPTVTTKVEEVVEKHADADAITNLRKEWDAFKNDIEGRLTKKESTNELQAKVKVEPAAEEKPAGESSTEPAAKPARRKFHLWRTL
jgi:hypothetical protein